MEVRPRISALLDQRWDRQIVAMVAGAGFGKSTALQHAMATTERRADREDIYVGLSEGGTSGADVSRILAEAVGAAGARIDDIIGALDHHPGAVCIILDDLHLLPEDSEGIEFLRQVIRRLPRAAHLVLASRTRPPLPLARARAANQVVDIGEEELAYTPSELADIAAAHQLTPDELTPTHGWPALVTLTVQVGHHGAIDFLVEEVLEGLSPKATEVLTVAVFAGVATPALIVDITGVDPHTVVETIPLVAVRPDGALIPHAIWRDTIERHVFDDDRQRLLLLIADHHRAHGDHRAAFAAATASGRASAIGEVVRDLGKLGHVALNLEEIDAWLARVPTDFVDSAEGRLLQAISARSANPISDVTKQRLQQTMTEFRGSGVVGCELIAMSELGFVLRSRGDIDELPALVERFEQLDALGHHQARHLGSFFRSILAERDGDVERALDEYDHVRSGDLSDDWISLVETQRARCLLLLGRPREAYESARRANELAPPGYLGGWVAQLVATWSLGVTSEILDQFPDAAAVCHGSSIDLIQTGARLGALQAMAGRLDEAARNIASGEAAVRAETQPEMAAFVDWSKIIYALSEGDPDRARRRLRRFLETSPLTTPLTMRMVSRYPAVADQLLEPDERGIIREELRGLWQRDLLAVSSALDQLRAGGDVTSRMTPQLVMCALPLPLALELAARAIKCGDPAGEEIRAHLVEVCSPSAVERASRTLPGDLQASASGAPTLARKEPSSVTLRLLGPMSIERLDGDTAPLRRQRVREMLALLAFDGPVSRDRLVDTLWPEHPVDKVRSNLRTTLSHLGRLRTIDDERLFVETNHGLDLQPDVKVDATEFDRLTRAAAEAQRAGADSAAFDHFARALEMVTGTPLDDVRGELYFDRLADIWMIAVVTAASQAAELGNRLGHHDSAIAFANLAIRIDQYHEPGYRLLIEAHLARGDRVAATATATALQAMLDDFGVEPESATNEVLARIQRQ